MTIRWIAVADTHSALLSRAVVGRGIEVARIYHNLPWAGTVTLIIDLPGVAKKSTHASMQEAQGAGASRIAAWITEVTT